MSQIDNKFIKAIGAALTASRALVTNGSGVITASATTSTELGYVSGVTSSIQTQINGLANTALSNLASTSVNVDLVPSASTINLGSTSIPYSFTYTQNILNPLSASNLTIHTQNTTGSTNSGVLSLTSGNMENGTSGDLHLFTGGLSGAGTTGNSGNISITTGNATGATSGTSGNILISTGNATTTNGYIGLTGSLVRMPRFASESVTGVASPCGSVYYNTNSNSFRAYTGSNWVDLNPPAKNYLNLVNGTNLNGNFELGTTTGWTLAHSSYSQPTPLSTASAGTAFSSSNGGSAASGNLSFSAVSSGNIAGTYSGSLLSSATGTIGDCLISNAFTIDTEDQAKVLTFKFYYKAVSGTTFDFSGKSTNSFAVWIYDVTNGAWIQPAGIFGMTQGTGVGICTGTFQTTSNSTKYQLAIFTNNATTTAYTVNFDDFYLGPQTAPIGAVETDWTSFTPTGAWSTNTTYTGQWRRVGDTMFIQYRLTLSGAPTSANLTVNLPSGYSIDTTKLAGSTATGVLVPVGTAQIIAAASGYFGQAHYNGTTSLIIRTMIGSASTNPYATVTQAVPGTFANGDEVDISVAVPIVGWSSNVQMSNDTDTRVVAAQAYVSSNYAVSANQAINYDTVNYDTHGGITTGSANTWKYTAPVSGFYEINVLADGNTIGSAGTFTVYKNGAQALAIFTYTTTTAVIYSGSTQIKLNAGDTISINPTTATTWAGSSATQQFNQVTIFRLSGPAVIAATESVNMSYTDTAGSAIGTSAAAYSFATKLYDSHNAYSGSTYTIPVSGKYRVSAQLTTAGVTLSTSQNYDLYIYKNGSAYALTQANGTGGTTKAYSAPISASVSCVAGDTIQIFAQSSVATTALTTTGSNVLSIERIGN